MLKALKDGSMVNDAPMTLDRLELLDNQEIRVKKPEPPDEIPVVPSSSNGKEATAETNPLAELPEDGKPKVEAGSNGNSD